MGIQLKASEFKYIRCRGSNLDFYFGRQALIRLVDPYPQGTVEIHIAKFRYERTAKITSTDYY